MAMKYTPYTLGELTRLYSHIFLGLGVEDLSPNSFNLYVVGWKTGITYLQFNIYLKNWTLLKNDYIR